MIKNAFIKVGTAIGMFLMVITPSLVQAANPCGSGYVLVEEYPAYNDVTSKLEMYADLYYSSSAKRNCLVASHAGATYGKAALTLAAIWPANYAAPNCPSALCDSGTYSYYAGPVYTPAGVDMSGRCVNFDAALGANTYKGKRNRLMGLKISVLAESLNCFYRINWRSGKERKGKN
ncbi:hypothetical protein HJFPF1_10685 [Paramyrothecium foliicola]|nr:hypothetical protein HJFPF1_10685 [Paramyrothecium foliicola]